ncbi:ABC transporter substrate-binding protein [Thalassobaculum fulvum]|uniref:ABC transporter substrate-binding protein n=1 Tax=Thalassobaculum fulvum TaxID=1633335 RepID=A0A918XUT7_9PROT|nr:extracellular solute-binding protein [Thalassobaculum fulvum]GHD55287.1 ABC transporter substrate-binding protein [Thalassobaculum fulvum]
MEKIKQGLGISRRNLMRGAAAVAGTAALGRAGGALAQSKGKIVVGTWGGDYARLLTKNIEDPILKAAGWEVIQDQAGDPQRRSKMQAERRLPRGTSDVQGLSALNIYQMHALGVTDKIDYSKLKNAKHILPSMKFEAGVGHIYSGKVAVYNANLVKTPPTSYADTLNPKHGSKLAIIDIQYQYTLVAAALAAGGGVTDMDGAKKLLLELRKAGCRIYPTNEAFAQGLAADEFEVGIMWKARTVQWQNKGINVKSVAPTEGTLAYTSGFVIPSNAPNKDGAYAYLDAMLEPSAQEAFAIDMGYNPTVDNANVAPDLNERIGFTPEQIKNLRNMDFGFMTDHDVELKEWWDKEFKA